MSNIVQRKLVELQRRQNTKFSQELDQVLFGSPDDDEIIILLSCGQLT